MSITNSCKKLQTISILKFVHKKTRKVFVSRAKGGKLFDIILF